MSEFELIDKSTGCFALNGVLDKKTVPDLWLQRDHLIAANNKLLVDLTNVTHSDSAGLALLVCLQRTAVQSNQKLSFINIPDQLQQLIELSHLQDILNI